MVCFNIFLHFLVVQYITVLAMGLEVFRIMFDLKENHCKIGKKSQFSSDIFWAFERSAKSPSSLEALVCKTLFLDDPLSRW